MPRFAANLTTMFQELPFTDRFAEARDCGFTAVEILSPYQHDISEIAVLNTGSLEYRLTVRK